MEKAPFNISKFHIRHCSTFLRRSLYIISKFAEADLANFAAIPLAAELCPNLVFEDLKRSGVSG
jgi:hypothetical protein